MNEVCYALVKILSMKYAFGVILVVSHCIIICNEQITANACFL